MIKGVSGEVVLCEGDERCTGLFRRGGKVALPLRLAARECQAPAATDVNYVHILPQESHSLIGRWDMVSSGTLGFKTQKLTQKFKLKASVK